MKGMNDLLDRLPMPLNTLFIEMQPGDYKDFGAASDYPLKGVTFATRYGYLPGYFGEDNVELDFFVGSQFDGLYGSFIVFRPELKNGEHKFYIAMSKDELVRTLKEYEPVVLAHEPLKDATKLLEAIEIFKRQ
ncbi:MAG: hypothetical protein JWP06_725 [Candidatus Saccharibacteria bacterium]|nr:hypothetical protein [Candidatus Saccharibacteria bacterium]